MLGWGGCLVLMGGLVDAWGGRKEGCWDGGVVLVSVHGMGLGL